MSQINVYNYTLQKIIKFPFIQIPCFTIQPSEPCNIYIYINGKLCKYFNNTLDIIDLFQTLNDDHISSLITINKIQVHNGHVPQIDIRIEGNGKRTLRWLQYTMYKGG